MEYWILRCRDRVLVAVPALGAADFPQAPASFLAGVSGDFPVGQWRGLPCFAAELDLSEPPPELTAIPLRQVFGMLGAEAHALAGRAVQLLDWRRHHRYCGACATATERIAGEFAARCPACGLIGYPRLSPAIMVLVRRGRELLLARSARFPPGVFSALAGFVEPGETLEQCVAREVREEVGIEIGRLEYFGSEPWPYPNSLMVAFVAEYAGGEIRIDPGEIETAAWFSVAALPTLPDPVSIARRLIDAARLGRLPSPAG